MLHMTSDSLQACARDYSKALGLPHFQVRRKGLLQEGMQFRLTTALHLMRKRASNFVLNC